MIVVADGRQLRIVGALRFKNRLHGLPGFHKWQNEQFFMEPTRANVEWIEREFPAAEWKTSHLKEIQNLRVTEISSLQSNYKKPPPELYEFKTEPFQHQIDAFMRSKDLLFFGYFMEMGTGKTKVLIDNASYLWHNHLIDALIVIAPNGVHRQFVTEQIPIHMPDDVDRDCFVYQSGGNKEFQMRKRAFLKPNVNKLRVLAINVEALSHQSGVTYVRDFLKSLGSPGAVRPVMCAVDESTRIKSPSAQRAENVRLIGSYCKYRRILSGSPVTKGVEDLFGQLKFLSKDVTGYASFYTFRARYCVLATRKGEHKDYVTIDGYQNLEELQRKVAPWVHRVKKEDCLDLPPKIYMKREVPLNEQQRDMYKQLRKEMLLEFENMTLNAPMAAVRMTKLQQIVCGHIRFTDQERLIEIPNVPRFDVVEEIADECDDQVIVWARFTNDIDRLCALLEKRGVSRYDGRVSTEDRARSIADFRSGRNQIFVGQPASAGLGLNLVGPGTVIYYSNSFDAEHRWQSEDRNHRAGTTKSVTYVDLVAPNTIDTYILAALSRKKDVASLTIDELKTFLTEEL